MKGGGGRTVRGWPWKSSFESGIVQGDAEEIAPLEPNRRRVRGEGSETGGIGLEADAIRALRGGGRADGEVGDGRGDGDGEGLEGRNVRSPGAGTVCGLTRSESEEGESERERIRRGEEKEKEKEEKKEMEEGKEKEREGEG